MYIYLFLPFLVTTELVKAESPPVNTWNSGSERTLHGPVPSFLLSLPCPSEGYFRHPKYCSQFYRCVDVYGSKRALSLFRGTCEPGLVFDEKISSCNWPDLSPPCSNYESSEQPVPPQDHPLQSEITSRPDFSSPGNKESAIVQQVYEVFTEIYSTKPPLTTDQHSQHQQQQTEQRIQDEEEMWQRLMPEQVRQEVQNTIVQHVHQQTQQEIQVDQQGQQQPEQWPQVQPEIQQQQQAQQQPEQWPQIEQEIQQPEQQVQQQEVHQQVQQQIQQEQHKVHPQDAQAVQQEPHQTQQQVEHQEVHQQQIQQQQQQQVEQQIQQEQQSTFGSDWWIPDEENAWTTKTVQHDVQNVVNNEELLCREEGFFQHPGNCSKFYRCVRRTTSFEIFVFECPQFLFFNQSTSGCHRSDNQACVTHEAAYRSLRSKRSVSESTDKLGALTLSCPEEGFFRHPKHCQVFYRCVQSSQRRRKFSVHTFVCPKNLVFDEKKGTCDWPEKSAPCSDNSMSISETTRKSSRTTRQPLRTTRQPQRSTRQPLRDTRQPQRTTRQPFRTTKQNPRTTRQPFRTTKQTPRTTQRFHATRQPSSKQKPQNKNDSRTDQVQRRPNIPHPDSQGRNKLKLTQSTERPRTQTQAITAPEVNCREPGFFTNRSDCNKYYKCVDRSGKGQYFLRYDFACPQNLAFDEITGTCKSRNRVAYCRKPQTNLPLLQDDDSQTETTSTTPKSSGSSKSQSGDKECKEEGYFRDPEDCNKFYRCVDFNGDGKQFVRYDFSCPEGLVFDEENSVCNWPSSSSECDGKGSKGSESENSKGEGNEGGESENSKGEGNEGGESENSKGEENEGSESSETGSSSTDSGGASSDSRSTEDSQSKSTTETTSESAQTDSGSNEGEVESSTSGNGGSTNQETSSTASSKDIQCTEEGYFRHPDDCNKFYRCVDFQGDGKQYVRYDFECPEGLIFDEENSVCNWPSSDESCEGGSSSGPSDRGESTSDATSQDQSTSEGTSQSQSTSDGPSEGQSTSEGTSQSQSTSDGTSQSQSTSTSSATSDTVTDSTTQAQTDSTDSGSGTSGSSGGTTESSGSTSSEEESSSQTSSASQSNDGECKEEGYFRHPTDCSKFYRCVDFKGDGKQFVRYDFECPEGLEFDEVNSVCNWPSSDSPCSGKSSEGGGTQDPSSSSTSGTDSNSSTETDSTTSTPGEDRTEEEATESSDKDKTNSESTTSDSSTSSTSDSSTSSTSDSSTSSTSDSSTSPTSDLSTSSTSDSSTSDSSTSSTTDTSTTSASDTSTSSSDSSSASSDSSGSEGSEEATTESSASESGGTSDSSSDSECTEEGFFRNPDDCSKFYRCVDFNGDGKQFVRYDFDCPEGLVFDEVNSVCNWPDSSPPCDSESRKPGQTTTQASSEGTTDSATDTSSSTEQTTTQASIEETSDSATDTSSKPEQTTTDSETDSQTTTSETTTTSAASETTEAQSETTTSATEASSSESQTTDSSGTTSDEGSNECTEEGYFRDPEDCSKFHRCVDSKGDGKEFTRYDFQCPEGLVFDDTKNKCNWPEESPPCESGPKQTTETESTTKSGETDSTTSTDSGDEGTTSGSSTTDSGDESTTSGSSTTGSGGESTTSGSSTTSSSESGECTEEGYFRDSSDCRKYYRCIENDDGTFEKTEFECEEDEVFDPEKKFCDKKELNPSCPDSTTEGTESTTEGTESTSDATETTEMSSTTAAGSSTGAPEESSTEESEKTTSSTEAESSSTSKSSTEKECTEEGFFRDPKDCNKFYRCVDFKGDGKSYVRYDFVCPEGLVFDEENSVCNWPSEVPECESSGPGEGGSSTQGETSSETQTDSASSSSTTSQETTSSATSEEPTSTTKTDSSDTTTSASQGQTDSSDTTTTASQSQTDSSSTTASSSSSTSSSSSSTTSSSTDSSESESKDIECTEEGFFRHPDDCTKFYRCVDFNGDGKQFVRYDFECPEGLVFDESVSVCNWPEDSPPCETGSDKGPESSTSTKSSNKESGQESTTSSTEEGTTQSSTSKASGGQTTETTSNSGTTTTSKAGETTSSSSSRTTASQEEKESSKSECEEEGFFRNPEDCRKYYRCLRNNETGELEKKEYDCPDGTVFDEEGRYCNAEELSPPCNSSGSFECTEEGFFRDPEDCTKYIQCTKRKDSETYEQKRHQCPEDHVFDEEGRYCNAKELSPPCDDEGESESSTTSGETTSEGQQGESSTTSGETTSEGQQGESSTSSGETTSEGQQGEDQSKSDDSFECKEEGFFRDPEDCTKYYKCSKNNDSSGTYKKEKHSCPDDHVFDEEGRYCNSVDLAPPCDESESSETTSDGSSSTQSRTTAGSTKAEKSKSETTGGGADSSTTDSSKTTSSSSRSGSQGDPECKEEGFFRNPNDCNKFYRCVDFKGTGESFVRYDFDCPEGLVFDEINSVCTWPTISPPCENKQDDSQTLRHLPPAE